MALPGIRPPKITYVEPKRGFFGKMFFGKMWDAIIWWLNDKT